MNLVVNKLYDLTCMECQSEAKDQTSAQLFRPGNNNNTDKQTTTTTKENYRYNDSSDAKVQQLLYNHKCFEEKISSGYSG